MIRTRFNAPAGRRLALSAVAAAVLLGLLLPAAVRADDLDNLSRAIVAINCRVEGLGNFLGTGAVVHPSGYVLTSTTVVPPKADNIRCHFIGAFNCPARLVVADEKLELALLKVDPPANTPAIPFRDSKNVTVGESVFTLGDAFTAFAASGKFTVSFGIISGRYDLDRQMAPQKVYEGPALETTATMAAGMDGGPLLDASGQIVGLLSLNVSPARWLGTAVPTEVLLEDLTRKMAADSKEHGGKEAEPKVAEKLGTVLFPDRVYVDGMFQASARRVAGSVVAIEVDRKAERKTPGQQRRPPGRGPQGPYGEILKRPKAPVTGLLLDRDGHVLTSWFNVWGQLNGIEVVLPGGQKAKAKLLAHDEFKDLAMLKFDPADLGEGVELTPAVISPLPLHLGSPVAAMGRSPRPADFTLTTGIVSAIGRMDGAAVQIDAAANYGNAGGPVIDTDGRVVGLVTHVRPDAMWSQNSGVGFAITSDSVRKVQADLKAGKSIAKPKHGYIGIQMSSGNEEIRGVVIERVMEGTPAAEAGLAPKDIITEVAGKPVADAADLSQLIMSYQPGDEVTLTVKRGDQSRKVTVTLDEHPYR